MSKGRYDETFAGEDASFHDPLKTLKLKTLASDCVIKKDVGCMFGKATFIKVNQLRYDSLSQKYQGTSVQVLIALNDIVFLLVKL